MKSDHSPPSPALVPWPAAPRSAGTSARTRRISRANASMQRPAGHWHPERQLRHRPATPATSHELAERECLAQFLHDRIGGVVVQLRLAFGAWRRESLAGATPPAPPEVGASTAADVLDGLLGELAGTVRNLSFALAPPNWHDDLASALASVATELRLRSGLVVRLDTAALDDEGVAPLDLAARTVVCRVVRELGLNVQKHAAARQVSIDVRPVGGRLSVGVEDDGLGLPAGAAGACGGLGLRSARAQLGALGGDLTLRSLPAGGTRATLSLPIRRTSAASTRAAHALDTPLEEAP